ncbi:GGDEF domain-containing protein [Pseudothauera rhizosphaerae]|nr:GGDEF domain-containing protein [Pseudothauera rhizosphaerae]
MTDDVHMIPRRLRRTRLIHALRRRFPVVESLWQRFPDNIFIIRCEPDGRFLIEAISPALERLIGVPDAEAAGRPIEQIVPPIYLDSVLSRYRECVANGIPLSYEETGAPEGTEPRHWLTLMVPAADTAGRVEYILGISRDITAIRHAEEVLRRSNEDLERRVAERTAALELANARLMELATRDGLTGLHNRRHFFELAERELARARRNGLQLSIVMLDLDYFKLINDSYGHAAGDHALREVAGLFALVLRETDIVGRYGGEEFAMLLPDTSREEARQVAERLRAVVAGHVVDWRGEPIHCSASLGVAHVDGGDVPTLDALLERADGALLRAKNGGRNRLVMSI